jgi:phosphomethylpyrimidine synthase
MHNAAQYNLKNLNCTEEIKRGYLTVDEAKSLITQDKGLSFVDCGERSLLLGKTSTKSALIKVCTNLGISSRKHLNDELKKIELLNQLSYKPDIIFDHTRGKLTKKPLWKYMVEMFDGVVAVAPVVLYFDEEKGIDEKELLEGIEELASCGVRIMLFHPTATNNLWEKAKSRIWPTTSWNGALLKRDMKINNRKESIITYMFDDILKLLKKHNVTCDIGTVFRPARISEALDEAHKGEIELQEQYIKLTKNAGVLAIREGVGHVSLDRIEEFCSLLDNSTPIMPLPVSTDVAIGFDHIACATATTLIGYFANLGVINPVTRVEHTGGIPTYEDIVEALKTARTVAHSLDLRNIQAVSDYDNTVSDLRQMEKSCRVSGGMFSIPKNDTDGTICDRCDLHCPFILECDIT